MPEALKDSLFNRQTVGELVLCIAGAYPDFNSEDFLKRVFDANWPKLELKERMRQVTLALAACLPEDYPAALAILRRAAEKHTGGFASLVFCEFVELYGLDNWDISLPALAQFTCLGSAEFSVRPFIIKDQARMLAQMLKWAHSDNAHQRRLASEGCRPRLPWAIALPALKKDPAPILPILDVLKNDSEDYVRRSVANNLNDITKDNPAVVLGLLTQWKAESIPAFSEIANRALRTLIKNGDPAALALVGFKHGSQCELYDLKLENDHIPAGGDISFSFTLTSTGEEPENLVIDYVIYHQRANGKQTPKVFKLSKKTLSPGESLIINKKHSFAEVTTRRYYPGAHGLEIQVNGVCLGRVEFEIGG
ncbi:MAG: DNA alkylation repair protein [Anaerolineae bacterium]|nr:DNA alkylation repair protein [Anaerolineae bacterium]